MEIPQPPQDTELRNIIDKLAQFVARNGPDFEQMTKSKQKGNPKFQFLYGGEHFNYYQYKVTTEQAILKEQGIITNPQVNWSVPPVTTSVNSAEIDQITQQQEVLQEQIKQSEQNLSAQHTVLLQQQQAQVDAAVLKCETEDLQREAETCGIPLQDFYGILQPIIDSCTKDSISTGKSWILSHVTNKAQALCIAHCLLYKVVQGTVPFSQKLHVVYLVNDVLHHCARKKASDLKDALESVVVPMFCNASIGANDDQKQKLEKLLKLWESKANYLAPETVEKMHQAGPSYQQYQSDQVAKYANEVSNIAQQTKTTFERYKAQHQVFVCHTMQQIMDLQQQKQTLEQQQPPPISTNIIPLESIQANLQQSIQSLSSSGPQNVPSSNQNFQQQPMNPPPNANLVQNLIPQDNYMPPMDPSIPPPILNQQPPNGIEIPFNQPPPGFFPPPGVFPDFSKPPPGFAAPPKPEPLEELMPSVPYYDLPAGLIVPLIKLEDTSFKPLDPKAIRLPPPAPPSERLLAAVDAFYSLPSHDRPRDSEGWEKLGLYEFYKAKNQAKKQKEEQIESGLREKSRSPSPVNVPVERSPSPPRRRYTSKSPSPPPHRDRRSRSRSPRRRRSRTSKRRRSSSRSRSRSRSPPQRSPSPAPPSFSTTPPAFVKSNIQELDASNKGHQMLRRMGWGGSGLGANEQGIDAPISGGDVRDRQDQFKGVGCNLNDPYENFRKNKGAAFITRMKARAEERAIESKTYE